MDPATDPSLSALPLLRRFVIYVPAGDGSAQPVPDGPLTSAVAEILCERFGGVTSYPATGRFTLASGAIQTESVMVLESYCEQEAWNRDHAALHELAKVLARLLRQESIAYSVDGRMSLVGPDGDAGEGNLAGDEDEESLKSFLRGVFEDRHFVSRGDSLG